MPQSVNLPKERFLFSLQAWLLMQLMLDQKHQHEYGHTEPHLQSAILMSSMLEILHLHGLIMIYAQPNAQSLQIRSQIDSN